MIGDQRDMARKIKATNASCWPLMEMERKSELMKKGGVDVVEIRYIGITCQGPVHRQIGLASSPPFAPEATQKGLNSSGCCSGNRTETKDI
jgi:hypothetical protein